MSDRTLPTVLLVLGLPAACVGSGPTLTGADPNSPDASTTFDASGGDANVADTAVGGDARSDVADAPSDAPVCLVKCSDDTCARLVWNFDSNTLEGATPLKPVNLQLAVRKVNGNLALAIDVVNLSEVSFRLPVCLTGTAALQTKQLSARVFFDNGASNVGQFYVQISVPDVAAPRGSLFQSSAGASSYETFTGPLSASPFSNTTTHVDVQAGTYGQSFSGTIWFDDIKIE